MTYAAITGWGKCMPPTVLTNADLTTFLDTNDEWITSRTGVKERRLSHVGGLTLAHVAAERVLACAGLAARDVDLIVYGCCSNDEQIPNSSSGLQQRLGAWDAAAMDVNTACTSFLYSLSTATAMIRTGVVRNAIVVGVEVITPLMDWSNRNVAVLFGDGAAAVVLERSDEPEGLLAEKLGCYADARDTLRIRGTGLMYANADVIYGDTRWDFDGPEIFKRAVVGMSHSAQDVLKKAGKSVADVGLVVPHQANLRIIEMVARRLGAAMDNVYVTVHRYGNMSSATVPVAMFEALDEGRIKPGSLVLTPAFGGGLTYCSHLIRWGKRTTPLATSNAELPPCDRTAVEMIQEYIRRHEPLGRSDKGLMGPVFGAATALAAD
jgi:3-oxoacyl-[acyl-carrier-protein] synthase-3